jgi:hypothetical protein
MSVNEIQLGNRVRDIVSGFEGIATSRVEYLNGCVQLCIRAKAVDNKYEDASSVYVDIGQVEKIDDGIVVPKKKTGGIMSNTPKAGYGLGR